MTRFGAAVTLGAALGVVQIFVIPRRLDVASFGAWRVFLVYAAYLGVLHVGLADGAFLRWAGRSPRAIGMEWRRVARWLVGLHGALLGAALVVLPEIGDPLVRSFTLAFAATAAGMNLATLAGYALQTAGDFQGAGRVAALAPLLFVAAVVALPSPSLGELLAAYAASFAVAAVVGALRVRRVTAGATAQGASAHGATADETPGALTARGLLRGGVPVLGANLAAGVSLFADRIVVSASVPVARFAQYGFASSVMVAASAATQALSRVALSHAARRDAATGERARFVDGFHDLVATASGVALAGVPAFEALVARLLPAYVPALPIVRALALGAPFGVAVHVVLVGTLQAHGLVRRQLALELAGLALALAACGACLAAGTPLWLVAAAASAAALTTWTVGGVLVTRSIAAARAGRRGAFALTVAAQGLALLVALRVSPHWPARTLLYAALALVPTLGAARAARAHGW